MASEATSSGGVPLPVVVIPVDFTDYFAFESYSFNGHTAAANQNDRYNAEDHFKDLILKTQDKMEKSTVAQRGKTKIDQNARKSSSYSYIKICAKLSDTSNSLVTSEIKRILPKSIQSAPVPVFNNSYYYDQRTWTLIQYDEGDQFVKHKDGRSSDEYDVHFGTLLLFPPKSFSKFEGGELVFYDTEDTDKIYTIIRPNEFDSWTLVAFPLNVFHECRVISNGTRYVFKSKITFKANYWKFVAVESSPKPLPITEESTQKEIDEHNKRIVFLQERVVQFQKEMEEKLRLLQDETAEQIKSIHEDIERTKEHKLKDKSLELLQKIETISSNIILILDRPYGWYGVKEESLIGEDRLLYNEIIKKYPLTKITSVKALNRFPPDYEGNTNVHGINYSLDLSDYYGLNESEKTTKIDGTSFRLLVQAENFAETLGTEYEVESEYNDEIDIPLIFVTAISIIKKK